MAKILNIKELEFYFYISPPKLMPLCIINFEVSNRMIASGKEEKPQFEYLHPQISGECVFVETRNSIYYHS